MKKKTQKKPRRNPEILDKTTSDDENGMIVNEAGSSNFIARAQQHNHINSDPQIQALPPNQAVLQKTKAPKPLFEV